jgi:hypothetical protein
MDNHHSVLEAPLMAACVETPPIVRLADRGGFRSRAVDYAPDVETGRQYRVRAIPAYCDTPGCDGNPGPLPMCRDVFHEADLRGMTKVSPRRYHPEI